MKQVDGSPFGQLSGTDRQILGEIELPVGLEAERVVHLWLMKVLGPLNLDVEFLNRVLESAQDAVVRAMDPGGGAIGSGHVHLLVFGPREIELDGITWGFFRIDKLEGTTKNTNPPGHAIEFYLYIEGQ